MKYFKRILARLFCLFVLAFAGYSRADDVVGVVRIDANTNGLVEVEMPFEPMGNTGPSGFVAGLFTGDGSLFSDLLFCRSAVSGVLTNAIWNGFNWLDPTTSFLSSMSVRAGDTLYFLRSDEEPFSFSLFGRHPAFLQSQELPRFSSICVDPTNETVALSVLSENCVYDLFSCDLTNVSSSTYYPWMHIARRFSPLAQTELADSLPIIGYARFYSVSDAALDADGDGISDALETFVYKTNPHLSDSDGDGISDGCEIAWGTNPLFVENASPFCWSEGFEKPNVVPGDVDGQNGWRASGGISPKVVEEFSFEGAASLALLGGADSKSKVVRDVELDSDIVWVDMRGYSLAILDMEEGIPDSVCLFARNEYGQIVAFDGDVLRSDSLLKVDELDWIRVTFCINYRTRKWDLYVNGIIAYSQLGLRGNAERLNQIGLEGGGSFVDNISITTTRPKGLSSDGDDMPDEWELSAFGTLERDGSGDFDLDGLSDADEAAHNTDPLNPDTDGDSIFDSWEVANALDPLDGSDATLDPDGDGMSNLLESQLGSNPAFYEPDPRLMTAGLYVEFFQTSAAQSGIPDFNWLNPIGVIVAETIDWREGSWPECAAARDNYFACRATGYVCIPKSGEYVFYVDSDDGVCLYVDGKCVVSDTAPHASREVSGKVMLEAGWRPIELHYYENSSVAKLVLSWSGPKFVKTGISPSSFCHIPPVVKPPSGFAFGLEASLYSFRNALTAMPDFSSLTPDCKIVASSIAYSSTAEPWAGMPETMADRFAALFEGFLIAEEGGRYDIALNSDDGSRLYIDGKLVIDNSGNHSMRKMLATVALSEGLHSLRLEYYENTDHAGLELSWAPTGGALVPVQPHSLCRQVANIDSDSDGLPDWWEEKYGFDFLSPVDATLDPDNDGLDNLGEFSAGSNPHLPDTDSDGMPDAWEAKNGTLPFIADALEDPDNDGLVNVEEYLQGSEPVAVDTDGDGLCDHDEKILGTNPREIDSVTIGDELVSANSGSVINISVDAPQVFAVNVNLLQEWHDYSKVKVEPPAINRIIFKIDGHFIGSKDVVFNPSNVVSSLFYTPVLPRGSHNLQIEWTSPDFRVRADIAGISVNRLSGVDFEQIVRRRNEAPGFVSTRISPAFIEGESSFPWLVSSTNAVVSPCGANNWYLYIPFDQRSVDAEIIFEGLVSTNVTVVWEPTDLFANPEDIKLRRMDKLLFSGTPDNYQGGIVEVFTNSAFACSYSPGSSAELLFPYHGEWNVHAVWRDERSGESITSQTMQVMCVDCSFPSLQPACQVGVPRIWNCPDMTVDLFYDTDMHTSFSINTDGEATILVGDTRGDRWVAARLYEGGPIVDVSRIDPMWAVGSFGNIAYLIESFEDSERCRTYLRQYGASRSVRFRVRSYTSSVVFDDYTTERWITPFDFDRNGIAWFEFLKSKPMASACHTVEIFQNDVRIGEAVYGNAVLPEELR